MKIYLAAPFETRVAVREWRRKLEDEGFAVTSRWLDIPAPAPPLGNDPQAMIRADLMDIDDSDVLVLFHTPGQHGPACRGSRHVEFGYHMWRVMHEPGKWLVLVGERENLFHYHTRCIVTNGDGLISVLKGLRSQPVVTDYPTQL